MIAQLQEKRADEAALQEHLDRESDRYDQGLADGMKSMMRLSLSDSPSYQAGYAEGLKRRTRFNITTEEQWLERGWGDELLNAEF